MSATEPQPQRSEKIFRDPRAIKQEELGQEGSECTCGLALSGGGIRSASFALGVVQAFLNPRKNKDNTAFDEFQYLSTVSGGGYLGGALTWLRSLHLDLSEQLDGRAFGIRNRRSNNWLDYIRQHGNYLRPNGVTWLSLISVIMRNVLFGFSLHFALVILLFSIAISNHLLPTGSFPFPILSLPSLFVSLVALYSVLLLTYPVATFIGSFRPLDVDDLRATGAQPLLGLIWAIAVGYFLVWHYNSHDSFLPAVANGPTLDIPLLIFGAVSVIFVVSVATLILTLTADRDGGIPSSNYRARLFLQEHAGQLLGLIAATGLVSVIPFIYDFLHEKKAAIGILSSITGSTGVLGALYQFVRGRTPEASKGLGSTVRLVATSALLLFGVLLGAYAIVKVHHDWISDHHRVGLGIIFLLGLLVNANYFGITRMYRDRLMETFMPDEKTLLTGQWNPALSADTRPISTMCHSKPYHLINTNVVMVDSRCDHYRGRGGDNFIITPKYCGSEATGYVKTKDWLNNRMNLPTAVAISGAAVNPNTGVGGEGVTRNRLVSFLLGVLQIRMGYWAPNTRTELSAGKSGGGTGFRLKNAAWRGLKFIVTKFLRPNFWMPGLRQGLFGRGLHSRAVWLELTDGGHFDNTAVYELIRRQTEVIVLSMASADPGYGFADLAHLIRKVRVDFGADIEFEPDALKNLTPDPESGELAAQGFAIADIIYNRNDPGSTEYRGRLVLLTATPTIDMQPELLAYRKAHPDFPHEPTSDQFYDEQQLEVYRELGYRIAKQFLISHPNFPVV